MLNSVIRNLSFNFVVAKKSAVRILHTAQNNIYFNLAFEEHLFESKITMPTLFLWRNNPTIVIGRHQNPWKQCKVQQMKQNGVLLSRRKSGGGAVYQDLGNTCFSFITPYTKNQEYDYRSVNNSIILDALSKLGVTGEVSGRNDLVVSGKKFSGSAYRLFVANKHGEERKALHHGTIMFSVDFQALSKYLNPSKKKLESKGIDSVISRVVNLQEINQTLNHEIFCNSLEQSFVQKYGNQSLTKQIIKLDDIKQTESQIINNYNRLKSWDWLYGECPYFQYTIQHKFEWGLVEITFSVKDGIIKQCKIYSDCLFPEFVTTVNSMIIGINYDKEGLSKFNENLLKQFHYNSDFCKMGSDVVEWCKKQL